MKNNQRGAALVTTLVFLIVLTIVGISAMQNNRLEQKMSTNIQEINHAFQYAESGLPRGLKSPELFSTVQTVAVNAIDHSDPDIWLCPDAGDPDDPDNCSTASHAGNASVETRYRGKGQLPPVNYSLDSGFASHFFFVESQGYVTEKDVSDDSDIRSRSRHEYGISLVGPSGL